VLADPAADLTALAAVLRALPEADVHRRLLAVYEEGLRC
jgi:hypothetical protein